MTIFDMAKKNYERGLWTVEMIRALAEKGKLTPREAEVFPLLAKGRNAAYIAENLGVSPATVKSHIYHIYQKLGVNSQQNLIDIVDGCDDRES